MLTTTFIPVIVIAVLFVCAIILIDAGAGKISTGQISTGPETVDSEVVDVVEIIDASSPDAFDPDDVYVLNAEDNFGPEDEDPYTTYSAKQR